MKKLLLIIPIFILSQCRLKVDNQETQANNIIGSTPYEYVNTVSSFIYNADGVTYRVFNHGNSYHGGAIVVINLTKDQLEIEKLRLEIENLKQ